MAIAKPSDLYARLMRHPLWVLGFLLALAGYLASHIPELQIDASSDSLVLEGDKSLEVFREVNREYGTSDFLFVTYRAAQDIFAEKTRADVAQLQRQLEQLDGVRDVMTYLDVPLLYSPPVTIASFSDGVKYLKHGDVDMALVRKEFANSPIYRQLLVNDAQTVTALQVNLVMDDALTAVRAERDRLRELPHRTAEQRAALQAVNADYEKAKEKRLAMEKQLVMDVRQILQQQREQAGAAIFLGGIPMIISDMLDYVRSDMKVFGSLIVVFMIVALTAIFRAPRWVVLPMATCLLTCLYMLGGLALSGTKLTVISANFVALLLIITLSITIHLVVRFVEYEKKYPDLDQYRLVMKTMRAMIKPCTYTTLTTMVAFASLVVSDIRPVIDFGWMMTVAVALALTLGFFVLPAGLLLLPRRYHESEDKVTANFTHGFAWLTEHKGRWLTAGSLVLLLFSVSGIAQLKVENRFIDYFDDSTEIYQGMLEIDAELGGTLPLDVVLNRKPIVPVVTESSPDSAAARDAVEDDFFAGDDFFASEPADDFASDDDSPYALSYWFSRQGMQEVRRVHDYLDGLEETGKVLSLATLYAVLNDLVGGNVDDIQLALMKKNLSGDIDEALVSPYLSDDGNQARIAVRVKETSKSLNRSAMLADLERFLQQEMGYSKDEYRITGMMVLYNNMLESLFRSQIATLGFVFVAIMLMFAVLFRSLLVSLLAIVPNILAALVVLGGMGWAGIPLDIMTITIAAITVGIGVDDTIHYIHRFKRELQADGDYIATMYRCHGSIGLAMFYTSVVIITGFSILALSNFTPSIYFGLLTGVAMFAALMGALLLLPHLLVRIRPFAR